MSLARIAGVACLLSVTLGASACSNNETTPQSTPWPTATMEARQIRETCFDRAKADAEAQYGENALVQSDEFTSFSERFERVGDPYGVTVGSTWSDEFHSLYQKLVGVSAWAQPEGRADFEDGQRRCIDELGLTEGKDSDLTNWLAPTPEEWRIIECIAGAFVQTEREYGTGSVDYSTAYQSFIGNRPEGLEDFVLYELDYERVTGKSPFRNAAAMEAFRAKTRACPEG